MTKKVSIGDLINEFVYQRYIMANNHIREYLLRSKFPNISRWESFLKTATKMTSMRERPI